MIEGKEGLIEKDKQEEYIKKEGLKELSEEQRKILNDQISHEEIMKTIEMTKIGKSPGPDGFMAKFYNLRKI